MSFLSSDHTRCSVNKWLSVLRAPGKLDDEHTVRTPYRESASLTSALVTWARVPLAVWRLMFLADLYASGRVRLHVLLNGGCSVSQRTVVVSWLRHIIHRKGQKAYNCRACPPNKSSASEFVRKVYAPPIPLLTFIISLWFQILFWRTPFGFADLTHSWV